MCCHHRYCNEIRPLLSREKLMPWFIQRHSDGLRCLIRVINLAGLCPAKFSPSRAKKEISCTFLFVQLNCIPWKTGNISSQTVLGRADAGEKRTRPLSASPRAPRIRTRHPSCAIQRVRALPNDGRRRHHEGNGRDALWVALGARSGQIKMQIQHHSLHSCDCIFSA